MTPSCQQQRDLTLQSALILGAHTATHLWKQDLSNTKNEVMLYALVFNVVLSKCMPCVHICGVFTFYCISVCLLAVRFRIRKENSSMKMNLKRKGIRYNKLLVWLFLLFCLFFFYFQVGSKKASWCQMKTNETWRVNQKCVSKAKLS